MIYDAGLVVDDELTMAKQVGRGVGGGHRGERRSHPIGGQGGGGESSRSA